MLDKDIVRLLAGVAADVYERVPEYEAMGFRVEPIFNPPTEVFIIYNDEHLIIAFRGTDSLEDAKLDLDFRKVSIRGLPGKYHRGIVYALNRVYLRALSKLQFKGANRKVWITGHSLGGALAVLFATRLAGWNRAHYINGVVTTGAPRVMDRAAAKAYNEKLKDRTLQLENLGDDITHVPFKVWGYEHPGKRKILYGDLTDKINERLSKPIYRWFLSRFPAVTRKLLHTKEAHSSKLYVRRVDRWTNG